MFDEITNGDMGELEKKFNQMMKDGTLRACPNMTHLPMEEKERISKQALTDCMETLMKTYLSLGMCGEAVLGAQDGFSGNKFKLTFKAMNANDPDEHLDGRGL
jgi:hypothetical protein